MSVARSMSRPSRRPCVAKCSTASRKPARRNARIDYFGVGIDLHTERPAATKIAKGVARILADPGYAERAARLQDELRSYEPINLIVSELAA